MKPDKCGKCYLLDRRQQYCERHKVKVGKTSDGTFIKCPACIEGGKKR